MIHPQGYVGYLTLVAHDAATAVFEPAEADDGEAWVPPPDAPPPPVAADDDDFDLLPRSVAPLVTPAPPSTSSAAPTVPRVNVLLIGVDSGVGRNTALTDTMIVASLDPVGRTVSLVSIPRDLVDVPLPDGRLFKPKLNGLASYVRWHPGKFPGAKSGQSVLAAAIGQLLGIRDLQLGAGRPRRVRPARRFGGRHRHHRAPRGSATRATTSTASMASGSRPAGTT